MNKLLTICPSRGRPKMCKQMVESFLATSKTSELIIFLDQDDIQLPLYKEVLSGLCMFTINKRELTYTEMINEAYKFQPPHEFYCVTNDDFFYQTDAWDLKLIETIILSGKHGIAFGNDLLQGVNLPTTSVISREICQALGWLQMPKLHHLFGDNVWAEIGKKCQCLHYRQDVIIEHRHPFTKKFPKDETFLKTNSEEMYRKDEQSFMEWLLNQSKQDIERVLNATKT